MCIALAGVVHEVPAIGSDGESEEASGASDEVTSPVNVKLRQNKNRRITQEASVGLEGPCICWAGRTVHVLGWNECVHVRLE